MFWKNLKKPFVCLAPMEGVTDIAFRQVVDECGAPDVYFTEFVNVTGMFSRGCESVLMSLRKREEEKNLVAQLWGTNVADFAKATEMVVEMGFVGVDINMGCPVRKIVNKGSCSALINNPKLASEIINSVKLAANGRIPVSVKTRIGFSEIVTERWIRFLLECGIDALIVHGRTAAEESRVPCHWDEIGKAVKIRDELGIDTQVIGNGDVLSLEMAKVKAEEYQVNGVMIGSGIFQNPWLFAGQEFENKTVEVKVKLLRRHVELFYKYFEKDNRPFVVLRRFFKIYLRGFDGASELREKVMQCEDWVAVEEVLKNYEL